MFAELSHPSPDVLYTPLPCGTLPQAGFGARPPHLISFCTAVGRAVRTASQVGKPRGAQ